MPTYSAKSRVWCRNNSVKLDHEFKKTVQFNKTPRSRQNRSNSIKKTILFVLLLLGRAFGQSETQDWKESPKMRGFPSQIIVKYAMGRGSLKERRKCLKNNPLDANSS